MHLRFPSRPRAAAAMLLAVAGLTTACGESQDDGEVTAVATTTHVADLVRNVGGDRVEVHQFLTTGADPHGYEPRPSDARAVAAADAVLASGGELDDWLEGVIENAGGDAEAVTLLDQVEREAEPPGADTPQEDEGAGDGREGSAAEDPHWWQDPRNATVAIHAIADALAEADPAGADAYRNNAAAYARRLEALDRRIGDCMGQIPDERRKLVTTHDSYGYFADRYDVEIVGALIPSRSSQAQPSAGGTAELVAQIEEEGVNAIFPESPLNPELEEAVAEESGATVGEPLWGDALGPEGSDGATYLDALASDAEAIAAGFTGDETACRIEP